MNFILKSKFISTESRALGSNSFDEYCENSEIAYFVNFGLKNLSRNRGIADVVSQKFTAIMEVLVLPTFVSLNLIESHLIFGL